MSVISTALYAVLACPTDTKHVAAGPAHGDYIGVNPRDVSFVLRQVYPGHAGLQLVQ